MITNINSTSGTCPNQFTLNTNPITNETVACVCAMSSNFYNSGGSCLSCANNPISGISYTDCTSCANSAGLFMTAKECIYCPNAPNSVGTATANGCTCKDGYYWSIIAVKCECDWTVGFVNIADTCLNCSAVSNSNGYSSKTQCIC